MIKVTLHYTCNSCNHKWDGNQTEDICPKCGEQARKWETDLMDFDDMKDIKNYKVIIDDKGKVIDWEVVK
jgi:Zn finger protein HypA/HybF involved in hydrogenase expression